MLLCCRKSRLRRLHHPRTRTRKERIVGGSEAFADDGLGALLEHLLDAAKALRERPGRRRAARTTPRRGNQAREQQQLFPCGFAVPVEGVLLRPRTAESQRCPHCHRRAHQARAPSFVPPFALRTICLYFYFFHFF